jgi:hypothetical protein
MTRVLPTFCRRSTASWHKRATAQGGNADARGRDDAISGASLAEGGNNIMNTALRGEGCQLDREGPRAYECYLVPAFFRPCAELLLDLAVVGPGDRVLDVACGTGIVARRAAVRVGGDHADGGGLVGGMDETGREAMIRELEGTLASHGDDDGVVFPMQTWLVTAGRRER